MLFTDALLLSQISLQIILRVRLKFTTEAIILKLDPFDVLFRFFLEVSAPTSAPVMLLDSEGCGSFSLLPLMLKFVEVGLCI